MYRLVIFLCCVSGAFSQLELPSACMPSNLTSVSNFSLAQFGGLWRQIERIENIDESGGDCFNTTYTIVNPTLGNIRNSWVVNRNVIIRDGTIERSSFETEGRFTVTYPNTTARPYIVLATDYTSYALVYSCYQPTTGNTQNVWAWKLSRTNSLSAASVTQINAAVVANPILQQANWRSTSHSDDACRSSSGIFYSSAVLVLMMAFLGLNKL